jgi:DNA-binding NtrC family response regulator
MTRIDESFRILIVDDNKELREILQEFLSDDGDVIDGASHGKEALMRHAGHPYDLIITDLNMPEVTGIELIRAIRQETDMTEFIIITGYASLDSAVEAIKAGAFDYIVKPFRMEELKVVVKNARDKIVLKKINQQLFRKLKILYDEIERYEKSGRPEPSGREVTPNVEKMSDTERIISEIRDLERLRRGRLLIE